MGDPSVRIGNMDFGIWWDHPDLDRIDEPFGLFVDYHEDPTGPDDYWFVTSARTLDDTHTLHATQSAGILAAQTDNGFAIAGIAGYNKKTGIGCPLYDLQLRAEDLAEKNLDAWAMAVQTAVDPLNKFRCDVISISLRAKPINYNENFRGALRFANEVGANIVCSNGRASGPGYPALFDKHWITVTGVHDESGAVITDSGRGHGIDLVSPGGVWTTTYKTEFDPYFEDEILSLYTLGSSATPHTAGSLALLRSYLGDGYGPEDYENILKLSSIDNSTGSDGDPQTWNEDSGHGKLRIDRALENVATQHIQPFQTPNTEIVDQELVEIEFFTGPHAGEIFTAYRCKVAGYISFSNTFSEKPVIWGRCEPAYTYGFHGLSDYSPNCGEPFHDVVETSVDISGCTAFTYVYLLPDENEEYTIWYPAHYSQIPVAVMAMGPTGVSKDSSAKPDEIREPSKANISPNPFNAQVTISYRVDVACHLTMEIIDLSGRRVRTLLEQQCVPGGIDLVWNGIDDAEQAVSSGTYFLRISEGDVTTVEKFSLVK